MQIRVKDLGRKDYEEVWAAMKAFTDSRDDATLDECWLLEHHPVFTQGQAGKAEHLIAPTTIPLVQSDRGGQVTYHGPGQLIIYLLIDLKRKKLAVREMVSLMESLLIQLLAEQGIDATLRDGAPGVYVDGKKIASLGLRVRKGCSYHGISLNVDMDLSPFDVINPCGYAGLQMTTINNELKVISSASSSLLSMDDIKGQVKQALLDMLGYQSLL